MPVRPGLGPRPARGEHIGDTAAVSEMSGPKVAPNTDMGDPFAIIAMVPYERLIRLDNNVPIKPSSPQSLRRGRGCASTATAG